MYFYNTLNFTKPEFIKIVKQNSVTEILTKMKQMLLFTIQNKFYIYYIYISYKYEYLFSKLVQLQNQSTLTFSECF